MSLKANITGNSLTAIGSNALMANTGHNNTAVGANAAYSNTSGHIDAFGTNAGFSNTTGNENIAFGQQNGYYAALQNNTTGGSNVAFATGALGSNTTGSSNSAFGVAALYSNTTGTQNTAVGYQAGYNNTTGAVTSFGWRAGYSNTTGNIIAIGDSALHSSTTAAGVVAIGVSAGQAHTTQYGSTYIGHVAGYNSTGQNVCIGYAAGYTGNGPTSLRAGGGNTLIGTYTNAHDANCHGAVVIGHSGTTKGNNTSFLVPNSGAYQGNNQTTWAQTSDRRLKKNITDSSIGLAEINQLRVRNFEYKTQEELSEIESDGLVENDIIDVSGIQVGVIAQEIQTVLPKCVIEQSTGVLSLDADNLIWHLIKAVQELSTKNDALEARIATLEG